MAYMCADSGNLMAIAQQVIKQKQQQQQQQQQQLAASTMNPFSSANPSASVPWLPTTHQPISDFSFGLTDHSPLLSDPFSTGDLGFPPPASQLDFADVAAAAGDFDSDVWMESLIGDSPTESSDLISSTAAASATVDLPPFFSAGALVNSVSPASDLDRVHFSDSVHQQLSGNTALPPPQPSEAPKIPFFDQLAQKKETQKPPSAPLLTSLIDCARIADSDPDAARDSLIRVRDSASELGDPIERVTFYFAGALYDRVTSLSPPPTPPTLEELTLCYKAFNEACPYSKFAHFTANQAILEATAKASRIHVIDFGIVHGVQWAALLQALATRDSGKPSHVLISGVPSPSLGTAPPSTLLATGHRLREFAELLGLDFDFEPVLTPVHELNRSSFKIASDESVAVNFMLQLCNWLGPTSEAVERILRTAKSLEPVVLTLGEHEANLNQTGFFDRFCNALDYYVPVFHSLDPAMDRDSVERNLIERVIFGQRILAHVGPCEENSRRERLEEKETWRGLLEKCGLKAVKLSNYAISQAKLLLWNYNYSSKYSLLESNPCFLSIAWEDIPIITVSSWG